MSSGSTSRPLYVPQVGQTRCGRFGDPHCGHVLTRGASILCWARRWSRRALDVFLLGTAIERASLAAVRHGQLGAFRDPRYIRHMRQKLGVVLGTAALALCALAGL